MGANQGCQDRASEGLPITCFHNPEVGKERTHASLVPAQVPKRVLVVGGGPAGLKAAELAARRGHRVMLVEREAELGGRLRLAALLPAARELSRSIAWVVQELEVLRVDVRTGFPADRALLEHESPDLVVLASGATPELSGMFARGDGTVRIMSTDDAMTATFTGRRVAIVDRPGSFDAVIAAEQALLGGAAAATFVTPWPEIGMWTGHTHEIAARDRLVELGCTLEPNWDAHAIVAGAVTLRHHYLPDARSVSVDDVVVSTPGQPNLALRATLEELSIPHVLAGDVVAPRTAMHAYREGDAVGRSL